MLGEPIQCYWDFGYYDPQTCCLAVHKYICTHIYTQGAVVVIKYIKYIKKTEIHN